MNPSKPEGTSPSHTDWDVDSYLDSSMRRRSTERHLLWILVPVLALLYAPGLRAPLGYDDQVNIVQEPAYRDWARTGSQMLLHPRPLLQLSYAFDYSVHHLRPAGCRIFSLLLWLAGVLAAGSALRAAIGVLPHAPDPGVIAPAMLLLAFHPFAVDGITFVSGRGSILAFLLAALSAWLYFESFLRGRLWLAGSVALFLLALSAKESAVGLVPALIAAELSGGAIQERSALAPRWRRLGVLVAPLPLLAAARVWIYGLPPLGSEGISWLDHLLAQVEGLSRNLFFWILPIGLSVDHGRAASGSAWGAPASLLFLALLWRASARIPALRWGLVLLVSFSLPWFLVPLSDLLIENRLIAPGIGAALILAGALKGLPRGWGRWSWALVALIFAALSLERNLSWADPVRLWSDAAVKAPSKSRPHHNLGLALEARGDWVEAERELRAAGSLDPSSNLARINLARLLLDHGQNDEAEALYRGALSRAPNCSPCRLGLGRIAEARGDIGQARRLYTQARSSARWPAEALLRLGNLDFRSGRLQEARNAFEICLVADPERAEAWANLGLVQASQGELAAAQRSLQRALELDPSLELRSVLTEVQKRLASRPSAGH